MKNILLIIIYLFSFISINCNSINNDFLNYTNLISKYIDFHDNGIKLSYTSNNSLLYEAKLIKSNLEKLFNTNCLLINNSISINKNKMTININLFKTSKSTSTDIELINYDNSRNLNSLIAIINKIKSSYSHNIKIYKYLRGKINNTSLNYLLNNIYYLDNIDTIKINNGYCGTATIKNKTKVNYSQINYKNNSIFIIGTPIIFTSY